MLLSLSGSSEWSPGLQVVGDVSGLVLRVQLEVVLNPLLALDLAVNILVVVPTDTLAFFVVEPRASLANDFVHSRSRLRLSGLVAF